MTMSDHGHTTARFGHPDHLGQHPVGVDPLDDGTRHGHVEAVVGERERLGIPFLKRDELLQSF
jgi:hypothetical protein